jgi:hypothetical protein
MIMRALVIGGLLLLVSGCAEMFGRQGMPADPLFASGKPAESKAVVGPAVAMPFSEPVPPVNRAVSSQQTAARSQQPAVSQAHPD